LDDEVRGWVERARAGDADALARVAEAFHGPAVRMARSILRDHHAAEDAAQEALVSALARLGQLEEPAAFSGWLKTIVRTHALRLLRRRRPDLVELAGLDHVTASPAATPPERLEASEAHTRVREAVSALSPARRDAVERFYLRGFSVKETAEALGVPEGTVKRRLYEAREALRPRLAGLVGRAARAEKPARHRLRFPLS
jgi:RNA polymerase sigma factor (sigma-70 family)